MKKFSDIQRDMLKLALAERVSRSCGFNELYIKNGGDGVECHIDGEMFAILGALAKMLHDMSNKAEIPYNITGDYLSLLLEIVDELENGKQQQPTGEEKKDVTETSPDFSTFMSLLTGEEDK